jgi:hypothetical protein
VRLLCPGSDLLVSQTRRGHHLLIENAVTGSGLYFSDLSHELAIGSRYLGLELLLELLRMCSALMLPHACKCGERRIAPLTPSGVSRAALSLLCLARDSFKA